MMHGVHCRIEAARRSMLEVLKLQRCPQDRVFLGSAHLHEAVVAIDQILQSHGVLGRRLIPSAAGTRHAADVKDRGSLCDDCFADRQMSVTSRATLSK